MTRQERLNKGFKFFYDLKPSEVQPKHIFWLHYWMKLLKDEQRELLVENLSDDQIKDIFK